jgi:hypothetical protein
LPQSAGARRAAPVRAANDVMVMSSATGVPWTTRARPPPHLSRIRGRNDVHATCGQQGGGSPDQPDPQRRRRPHGRCESRSESLIDCSTDGQSAAKETTAGARTTGFEPAHPPTAQRTIITSSIVPLAARLDTAVTRNWISGLAVVAYLRVLTLPNSRPVSAGRPRLNRK